jgi:group I intron endonuclease
MFVYRILNKINNKVYIGSTNNYLVRKHEHFNSLRLGKHHNTKLQSDYNKFGRDQFVFDVLISDIKDRTTLLLKEYDLILKNKNWCYNSHFDCPVFDPKEKQDWSVFNKPFISKHKIKKRPIKKAKNVPTLESIKQWKLNRASK